MSFYLRGCCRKKVNGMNQSGNISQWSLNKLEELLADCQSCYNDYFKKQKAVIVKMTAFVVLSSF